MGSFLRMALEKLKEMGDLKMENLFLATEHVDFYSLDCHVAQRMRFLAKPKTTEDVVFMERMNGALNLMHQHIRLQQYNEVKFLPQVEKFDAKSKELTLTVQANPDVAVPTLLVDYDNYIIDCKHATWITKQAFQLASLANEAGIVLPFSTENFLICYESQSFVMLDWSKAKVGDKIHPIDATVAQKQVVELARMLADMVDYNGGKSDAPPKDSRLWEFMGEAGKGGFLSTSEASRILNATCG